MKMNSLKYLFLLCYMFISTYTFSQGTDNKKTEIENTVLKEKIIQYNEYLIKWKLDNQIKNYIITVDEEKSSECSTFTLNVILFGRQIDLFNPSYYALINDWPILIHTGVEPFIKRDTALFSFLKFTYWKEGTLRAQENEAKQLKIYKEKLKGLSDSVQVYDKKKKATVTIARSSMKPFILDPELNIQYNYPKSWILKFQNDRLVSEWIEAENK